MAGATLAELFCLSRLELRMDENGFGVDNCNHRKAETRFGIRHRFGTASDPLVASAAQVAWEKAEEYDSLLAELKELAR